MPKRPNGDAVVARVPLSRTERARIARIAHASGRSAQQQVDEWLSEAVDALPESVVPILFCRLQQKRVH